MAEKKKKGVMSLNDRHYRLLQSLSSVKPPTSMTMTTKKKDNDAPHFSLDLYDDDDDNNNNHSPSPPLIIHEKTVLKKSDNQDLPADVTEEECTEEEKKLMRVKVHGRRRLCKVSSLESNSYDTDQRRNITSTNDPYLADFDSPFPSQKDKDTGSGEDIRDILNDLSFRLDLLSIERKPAPRNVDSRKVPLPSVVDEYVDVQSSPSCSISAVSDPFSDASYRSAREDELASKDGNLYREEKNEEPIHVKKSASRTFAPTDEDFEDEDDECMIMGENKMVKKTEGLRDKFHEKFDYSDEADVLDIYSDDEVYEDENSIIMTSSTSKYVLPGKIATMLFPHQRDGLKWLWSLHTQGKGGILGDDMGLGKTMQMCGFLAGMFHSNLIKRALIVAPKTLLPHWVKELSAVGLSEKTREYFGTCTKTRQYELQYVLQDNGVLLTTYDIVRNNTKALRGDQYVDNEDDIMWDYMILDEGHLIKNPGTQRAKSLLEIPSAHRIIISGTPIQNNLKELWALFNFCCPELLGDNKWFKAKYESPILRGNDKYASDREKRIGSAVAKELREHIEPYFLRRLKSDVFRDDDDSKEAAKLSKKNEIIVWLKLTSTQRQLYEAFLKSELVLSAFDGSPLAALTILKKICDHPLLLTKRAAEDVLEGMDTMLNPEEKVDAEKLAMHIADMTERSDFEGNHDNVSCKISFILSLLDHLIPEGHCTLIFSQTRKMLNLIQDSLVARGYKFLRIDGTTKACDRVQVVNDFQEGVGAPIFLLTSQVGGLGLTLTKADRVIVVDPAWNPSTDNQSVDRAYRIGQKKDVVVYRLMTCGTIEEKIYRKQIYKGGLFKTATEHKEQTRYFSQSDLQELFSLPKLGFDVSPTQQQLLEEHDSQHEMSEFLKAHVQFLETQGISGVSQHSLLFSKTATVPKPQDDEVIISKNETRIMGKSSYSTSRIELDVDGAKYAFNPKDVKPNKRSPSKDSTHKRTEAEVNDRIARLSRMLVDKVLVSRLPDNGDNIRKQLVEMKRELDVLQKAGKSDNDVICLDDISEEFQKVLNV